MIMALLLINICSFIKCNRGSCGNLKNILLIDEVLSVGDEKFAKKSYYRMKELIEDKNHTVVIVSHNLQILEELCDEILWLHEGNLKMLGETKLVLKEYKIFMQ